jgi:hypothetical protein
MFKCPSIRQVKICQTRSCSPWSPTPPTASSSTSDSPCYTVRSLQLPRRAPLLTQSVRLSSTRQQDQRLIAHSISVLHLYRTLTNDPPSQLLAAGVILALSFLSTSSSRCLQRQQVFVLPLHQSMASRRSGSGGEGATPPACSFLASRAAPTTFATSRRQRQRRFSRTSLHQADSEPLP